MEDYTKNIKVYDPVWTCIYCGKPHSKEFPLGREHIIPYNLGGRMVLPRASCTNCSAKTRDFEITCARSIFGPMRITAGLPTRNPQERPRTLPLTLTVNGEKKVYDIPSEDYPIMSFGVLQMRPSNLMEGRPSDRAIHCRPRIFNAQKENAFKSDAYPVAPYEITQKFEVTPFCQMLCKVAHSFAVGEHGLASLNWLLPDLIIGGRDNFSDYLGGMAPIDDSDPQFLGPLNQLVSFQTTHTLKWEVAQAATGRRFLTVVFQLFADFVPPYRIIVAEV